MEAKEVYVPDLARGQGFEPQFSEPESDVLPLDDPRMKLNFKVFSDR